MTDFGAEESFSQASARVQEHYGIEVPLTALAKATEKHAKNIFEKRVVCDEVPDKQGVDILVAEVDGSMIPIVDVDTSQKGDKRKTRSTRWKEARLCLARVWNSVTGVFRVTTGSVDEVGDLLLDAAIEAGMGTKTKVHGVGDGAKWIKDQFDRVFSVQASYLLDFFHVCEYLSSAAKGAFPDIYESWYEKNKRRLKNNYHKAVIKDLSKYLEADHLDDTQAPVRACHRYLSSRTEQLNYKGARNSDLPIGSGEIESGHRYIIQKRLKISGAWWKDDNASYMLALREIRCNDKWKQYWEDLRCPEKEEIVA